MEGTLSDSIRSIEKELPSYPKSASPVLIETIRTAEGAIVEKKLRPFISKHGDLCFYIRGARRWGTKYSPSSQTLDLKLEIPQKRKTKEAVWFDSWDRVRAKLEKSGLWADMLKDINTALDIGLKKIATAYKAYKEDYPGLPYEEWEKKRAERVAEIDCRLSDSKGVNTDILWYMKRPAKVKKMYFGKYRNEEALEEIRCCVDARKKCSVSGRAGYDVRFEYNPEKQMAWYSEEYKNCGNGHYYLALDATHAIYYEDD